MSGQPASSRWGRAGAAQRARVSEVDDAAKPELLRRYLARWYWQVKDYVAGLTPDSSDEQLRRRGTSIPVFALEAPVNGHQRGGQRGLASRRDPGGPGRRWPATTPPREDPPTRC